MTYHPLLAACLVAVAATGCTFDRSGSVPQPGDSGAPDVALDATQLPDHPVEDGDGPVDVAAPPDLLLDGAVEGPPDGALPDVVLDGAVEGPPDGALPDVPDGAPDGVLPDGPTPDSVAPDQAAPDTTVDLPATDAPVPDLAPPIDQGPPATDAMDDANIAYCAAKYGGAPDYILCWVTPSGCAFNANTNDGSCDDMCGSLGGTCIAAWDNPNTAGQECSPYAPDPCSKDRNTNICLCSK